MSSFWDVPQYLIMAFSLAFDAPTEKASRVSLTSPAAQFSVPSRQGSRSIPEEAVWLRAIKTAGAHSDVLQRYAARIFVTTAGRYYVPTEVERAEILALRFNPQIAARVVAAATQTLLDEIRRASGVEPSRGALVIAHLLGADVATRYARALRQDPHAAVRQVLPTLAARVGHDASLTLLQLDARLSRATLADTTEVASASATAPLKGTLMNPERPSASKPQYAAR